MDRTGSSAARATRRALAAAALLAVGCASPPPALVTTPWGDVRADTPDRALALASRFTELRPAVLAALPGGVERSTEVWLDSRLGGTQPQVAALTEVATGRIRLRGTETGIGDDFLLVHELVHAFLGPDWDPLPAILKEGVCDALACRLVPDGAPLARALRFFGARLAFGDQEFVLAQTSPSFGVRRGARVRVTGTPVARREPLAALALGGRGVSLHDGRADEDVLYGFGLLATERAIRRIGLPGLLDLCRRAREEGHARLPEAWVLWAAGLSAEPAAWDQALAQELGVEELRALSAWLAEPLAAAIAGEARLRLPDLDGPAWLAAARLSLGLRGTDHDLPLEELPELRDALLTAWTELAPPPLPAGQIHWQALRGGGRDGLAVARHADGTLVASFLHERAPEDGAGQTGDVTGLTAELRLGRDERGAFVSVARPDGFADFRVVAHGVVVADLGGELNVETGRDARGWITLRARLAPETGVQHAILLHPEPNVVVALRGAGSPAEQRVPLRVPAAH